MTAKREQIAFELATLADELFRDNRCRIERMTELVEFCRKQCRHRLWRDVAAIEFTDAIASLAAWERKLPQKSLRRILARSDVLSFDVINGLEGYTMEISSFAERDGMIQSIEWPQPSISVLKDVNEIIEQTGDVPGEPPLALEILEYYLLPAFICLLIRDFCRQSESLTRSCKERKVVQSVFIHELVLRIGSVHSGRFRSFTRPLGRALEAARRR